MKLKIDLDVCRGFLRRLTSEELGQYVMAYEEHLFGLSGKSGLHAAMWEKLPDEIRAMWHADKKRRDNVSEVKRAAAIKRFAKPVKKSAGKPASAGAATGDALAVFEHWQKVMAHPRARLDDKLTKLIEQRIKEGYTSEDLMLAVDGCAASAYHMGANENKTRYDSLELILRDSNHVANFISKREKPTLGVSATTIRNIQEMESF